MNAMITRVAIVSILLGTAIAQDDKDFDAYHVNRAERQYILALNRQLEESGVGSYPLPPVVPGIYSSSTNNMMSMCFANAPLAQFLSFYSEITGMKTVVDDGLDVRISYIGHRQLSYDEALRVIGKVLHDKGLMLTKVDDQTVRVHRKENGIEQGAPEVRPPPAGGRP